jgi:dienelactone hydrolase
VNEHIPRDIRPAFPQSLAPSQIQTKLLELLGLEDVPDEIEYEIEWTREEEGLRLTGLTYRNCLGESVPGILATPPHEGLNSLPAVVCVPGTSGTAERVAGPRFYRDHPSKGPLYGWGRELARRGFATLSISPKCSESRRGDREDWMTEAKLLAPYGRSQMGVLVDETLRAGRILAASPPIDPARIGLTGMSLGGQAAWYAMASAPWIRTAAPVCGALGSMAAVIHHGGYKTKGSYYFIPHMLRYFDHPEIVEACIAPRPLMVISPAKDASMPPEGVDALLEYITPVYDRLGHPERFKVHRPDNGHLFLPENFEWIVQWFQRFL